MLLAAVARLINRGLYPLAMEICSYLKVPPVDGEVKVLRQWAMRKVGLCWLHCGICLWDDVIPLAFSSSLFLLSLSFLSPHLSLSLSLPPPPPLISLQVLDKGISEELLGEMIVDKLTSRNVVVSFAEIARVARKHNRKHLAAMVGLCVRGDDNMVFLVWSRHRLVNFCIPIHL